VKLGPKIHIDSSNRIVALSHVIELLPTGDFFATHAALKFQDIAWPANPQITAGGIKFDLSPVNANFFHVQHGVKILNRRLGINSALAEWKGLTVHANTHPRA
jgi:hypothetical protein